MCFWPHISAHLLCDAVALDGAGIKLDIDGRDEGIAFKDGCGRATSPNIQSFDLKMNV